jgi:hypothetical protein
MATVQDACRHPGRQVRKITTIERSLGRISGSKVIDRISTINENDVLMTTAMNRLLVTAPDQPDFELEVEFVRM